MGYPVMDSNFDNERGFWEPRDVVDIHEDLLHDLGLSHDSYDTITASQLRSEPAQYAAARLVSFMEASFHETDRLVVVKDPRLCRLIPLWRDVLNQCGYEPAYVLPIRHPLEVAQSLRKRNGYHLNKGQLMWLGHILASERETRGGGRSIVSYSSLMNDWRGVAATIASDLGLSWPRGITVAGAEIDDFLDPGLRHHSEGPSSCATDLPWIAQAWAAVNELMRDSKGDGLVFDAIAAELDRAGAAFFPLERAAAAELAKEVESRDALIRLREDELAHVRHAERVLIERLAANNADMNVVQEELEAQRLEISAKAAALEEVHAEADAYRLANIAIEAKATELQTELSNVNSDVESLRRDRDRLRALSATLESQRDQSARTIADRDGKLNALGAELSVARMEIAACERAVSDAAEELAWLSAQRHAAEVRLAGYAAVHGPGKKLVFRSTSSQNSIGVMKKVVQHSRFTKAGKLRRAVRRELEDAIRTIGENRIFDADWYLSQYPDVERDGADPLRHYCTFGWREGRNPAPNFDTLYYLGANPDVAGAGINPLLHWVRFGKAENRPVRGVAAAQYRPVTISRVRPLAAALTTPGTDDSQEAADDVDLIAQSGLFDETYYRDRNPDVARSGGDPLTHFCHLGWREGRAPCAGFSVPYYLEHNPDVAAGGGNPFCHWILYGRAEGRPCAPANDDDYWDTKGQAFNPSIIFVSHEASRTGAPIVLLSMLRWLKANTNIRFGIVIGADGPLRDEFRELAPCFFMDAHSHEALANKLRAFCGVNVQVVYLNTIVSGIYGDYLRFLNAKFITHVHEMESLFVAFEGTFRKLLTFCEDFIAVSDGSVDAIQRRVRGASVRIAQLPPFIEPFNATEPSVSGDPDEVPIIYACGTLESRKGPDIFCDVAEALLKDGVTNFRMKWIGPKASFDLAAEISRRNLDSHVQWLGPQREPRRLLQRGAVFLLTSREDPFPLACLEAAEQGLPVICFDSRAGSMHSFVGSDAGIVVPQFDASAMAAAIKALLQNDARRRTLGARAGMKVAERHLTTVACPMILSLLPNLLESTATDAFEAYKEQIDRVEMVSFDIFDTLITRSVSNPNTVFDIVEARHSADQALPLALMEMRMQVAGHVLGKHHGKRDDVSIDDIYAEMPLFRDAAIEKATEVEMVVPHPLGARLYDYARSAGKAIVIVSDMYLDEGTIEAMLAAGGIKNWDRLFLSSKLGLKKDTGRLFPLVVEFAESRGIQANQILHIGDNWEGDVHKAKAGGMNAIRFIPLYESKNRKFPIPEDKARKLSQIGRIWNDFTTQASLLWSESNPHLNDDVYMKLGFELTGPLAAMMAMYVRAQAERLGARKIVFMARDGRIILKAFQTLYRDEVDAGDFDLVYAHLSRAVVVPATLRNPLSSSDLYFLIEGLHLAQKPIRYFLEKAGLNASDADILRKVKARFPSIDAVPSWNDLLAITSLMSDLADEIYAANASVRERLKAYLSQKGITGADRVVVVDVGWLLNIQSRFHRFCRDLNLHEDVFGVYVGSRERTDKSLPHAAFLFDGGDPRSFAELIEENTTLFEVLFSAPEPAARGLCEDADGCVTVDFKSLSWPYSKEFLIAQKLHFGAEAYLEVLARAQKTFMPRRLSRDFFMAAFEALVWTDDPEAHRELGAFEIMLGGQHDLHARQSLLRAPAVTRAISRERTEYFPPMRLSQGTENAPGVAIVTSAGLDNGSTRYRGVHLGLSLGALGNSTVLFHAATDISAFERETRDCSTVVFQRCFQAQGNVGAMLNLARQRGQRCVMEMDDLVFPEFVPIIGSVVGGEWNQTEAEFVAASYAKMLDQMDAAIVSTAALEQFISRKWDIPTAVYHNRVASIETCYSEPARSLKIIFASGTYSHKEDFLVVSQALRAVLAEYPHVQLSLLGATQVPEAFLGLPNVTSFPLLPYGEMLRLLGRHNLMIVPLVDSLFNNAKSNVKFIECASVGVPILASNVAEYASVIRDGETGFIAETSEDWYAQLARFANDCAQLRVVGEQARRYVCETLRCETVDEITASQLRAVLFERSL
jgi:glycosyltransferase involved in cell wall biosynthesis/FMN phosphatase YigB (HAD superfamily)